jgi:hypothetical protein
MGRGTGIDTGTISAPPLPDGPAQATWSSAPDSGFQAAGTADFLADAINSPGDRGAFAESIAEGCFSCLTLNHDHTTWYQRIIMGLSPRSAQSHPHNSRCDTEIRPLGLGASVVWRYESRS